MTRIPSLSDLAKPNIGMRIFNQWLAKSLKMQPEMPPRKVARTANGNIILKTFRNAAQIIVVTIEASSNAPKPKMYQMNQLT
jgi:hypothetical protein